jgi:hypothetical protein
MSKFSEIHPGGLAALLDPEVGKSNDRLPLPRLLPFVCVYFTLANPNIQSLLIVYSGQRRHRIFLRPSSTRSLVYSSVCQVQDRSDRRSRTESLAKRERGVIHRMLVSLITLHLSRWPDVYTHPQVPYAEPMFLSAGYKQSPYYKDSHYRVQKEMRKFIDEHVYADAQACEESGKRMSQKILDMMG